jgi:hypothetical protein
LRLKVSFLVRVFWVFSFFLFWVWISCWWSKIARKMILTCTTMCGLQCFRKAFVSWVLS